MRRALVLLATVIATPAAAQQDMSRVEIKVERVTPGVAVLFGAGGNIGLSYGEDGNVIIDDQYAPLAPRIAAAVKAVDPDPVRFVINTHWHGDHTGGNEAFGKAGAVIVAHDNVRRRMSADVFSKQMNETIKASPKAALPVVTFSRGVNFHLNGDMLQVTHVDNAHTDGDALVYWTRANVLHMGDTFFFKATYPFIDRESGGSIDGMIAAAKTGLGIVKPGGKVIPGHGPIATREDLQAYHAMLVDVRAKVAAGIRAGRTKAQVIASRPTAPYDGKVSTTGFIKPDRFVETMYDELKPKLQPARKR
ncbi:glyoxylase-like metal-dependent hydrolase (beta-lactamase superfamily II) [Sphingomonas kaistensis]|uniref:beta-lactamase n=1 Tax=Sphingomonas kaistensis TaxID=298708 RepID=A0A7X6BG54_9SPHN|nr:MBL fold metallo-hydrolase [Sphingomonas kaistensis]NJC06099.1 glyoxylase-like metal-dependent hydrolase (beta-lactamase superfamily II) [Sphingomonas kaistensis]